MASLLSFSVAPADASQWSEMVEAVERQAILTARRVLELVGEETIDYLRSLTEELRPPAKSRNVRPSLRRGARSTLGTGEARPAHPGHWADVTGALAKGYAFTVEGTRDGARLILRNDEDYAAFLEAREGFFVLSGVTEPGGPVERALRAAVAAVAPDWRVT